MSNKAHRMSFSSARGNLPLLIATAPDADSDRWIEDWRKVYARGTYLTLQEHILFNNQAFCMADLIDSRIVAVDAETSVEDACDVSLPTRGCLLINISI